MILLRFDANEEEALSDGDDDDELNGNESEGEDGNYICFLPLVQKYMFLFDCFFLVLQY